MTALTPERLAEIERDYARPRHFIASPESDVICELLAHIDHLTALIESMRSEAAPYRNETVEAQEADRVSNPRGKQ